MRKTHLGLGLDEGFELETEVEHVFLPCSLQIIDGS